MDDALAEIERLPGRHLYFLDDHLFGDRRFAEALFGGMRGMGRVFQGAATVDSILRGDLVERAAEAGLRSLFVGFETLDPANLASSNKRQNLGRDYAAVTRRLHDLGIMINGSFVFGMDDDDPTVFRRTVDWAIAQGITTATFHIQTPYPGTRLFARTEAAGRLLTRDWDRYDTRQVVYQPARLTPAALKDGYDWAYREFYRWSSIARASLSHGTVKHQAKHFFYATGWKKFEPLWDVVIRARQLRRMTPLLEGVLSRVTGRPTRRPGAASLTDGRDLDDVARILPGRDERRRDTPAGFQRRAVDPMPAEGVGVDAQRDLIGRLREAERGDRAFVGRRPHQAAVDRAEAAPQLWRALRRQHVVDPDGRAEARSAPRCPATAGSRVPACMPATDSEGGRPNLHGRVLLRRFLRLSRLRAAGIALAASRRTRRLAAAVVVRLHEPRERVHHHRGDDAAHDADGGELHVDVRR